MGDDDQLPGDDPRLQHRIELQAGRIVENHHIRRDFGRVPYERNVEPAQRLPQLRGHGAVFEHPCGEGMHLDPGQPVNRFELRGNGGRGAARKPGVDDISHAVPRGCPVVFTCQYMKSSRVAWMPAASAVLVLAGASNPIS